MFTRIMRWTYVGFSWLFFAGIIVQFYLAGYAVFSREQNFETHASLGFTLGGLTLIGILLAFAARVPWSTTGWRFVLFLQIGILQSVFATFRINNPAIGAFHVVDAIAIFGLSAYLAIVSRKLLAPAATEGAKG